MARRASSSTNPILLVGIGVAVIAVVFAGKFLLSKKSESFTDAFPLDVKAFVDDANAFRGDEFFVEGKIDEKLRWTPSDGQIISIRVKTPSGEEILPIQIPDKFNNLNIDREQSYAFKIEIKDGGIAVATAIKRL
ncbi:MAG: hypothetical protein ACK46A_14990 [Akkermansiaceae bacterium]|jgi:hypothetical protein|nr:hypothetical protein [Luteolibacter sp.]